MHRIGRLFGIERYRFGEPKRKSGTTVTVANVNNIAEALITPPRNADVRILGSSKELFSTARRIDTSVPHTLHLYRTVPDVSKAPAFEKTAMATPTSPECLRCTKPGRHTCSGCRNARYCSPACRNADWPIHELLCYAFPAAAARPPGSESLVRVIFFPAEFALSSFEWVSLATGGLGRVLSA